MTYNRIIYLTILIIIILGIFFIEHSGRLNREGLENADKTDEKYEERVGC